MIPVSVDMDCGLAVARRPAMTMRFEMLNNATIAAGIRLG